jgi:YbbR domain-containing protein
MNKLIDSLFEKDSIIKAISIITAILIWFLVLDQDNPFEERTIAVPLSSNIEVLQSKDLQIVGTPLPTSIDIKIKGRRKKILGITANDFEATIDLSGVTESGTRKISINMPKYLGDQDVIISGINPTSVNLNFERIIGRQYPVILEYKGKLPEGYELVNVKVGPTSAILDEKESIISRVSKVVALVNLDEIKDNKELELRATVLDNSGELIRQFEGKVPIIVTFDLAKRVPVMASAKGDPLPDFYMKEIRYSLPHVRVIGPRSVLDSLIRINAEDVDITGLSETFKTPLILTLPDGTSVYKEDTDLLSAEVVLERFATRTINVPSSMISIYESDVTGSYDYRVTDEFVEVTIKGRPENINALQTRDIMLSVNAGGMEQGEHEVPVTVQVPGNTTVVGEYTVKMAITEAAPGDEQTSGSGGQSNP